MEYVLDVAKWRCGLESGNKLGEGNTKMLNPEGYMCCLGQFAKQVGIHNELLLNSNNPISVQDKITSTEELYDKNFVTSTMHGTEHTDLGHQLVRLNDNIQTDVSGKIFNMHALLHEYGHTLKVIDSSKEYEVQINEEAVNILANDLLSELMKVCDELDIDVRVCSDHLNVFDGATERQGEMTIKELKEFIEAKRILKKLTRKFK